MNISSNHWQLSLTRVSGWMKEGLIITGNFLKHSPAQSNRESFERKFHEMNHTGLHLWQNIMGFWANIPIFKDHGTFFYFIFLPEVWQWEKLFSCKNVCFASKQTAKPPLLLHLWCSGTVRRLSTYRSRESEMLWKHKQICECVRRVCGCVFWFALQSSMAEAARGPGLTAVVLNWDVVGQQLVLAAHTDEQRTSSPVWKMEEGSREQMTVWRGLTGSDMFMGRFRMNEWDPVNPGWPLCFFLIALLQTLTSNLYGW